MIQSKIFISFFIVFSFLLPASMALATQDGAQAVIFMYHRFGESRYPRPNLTLEQFEEQLEFFEKNNFSVLPLLDIVEALKENNPLPERSIGITMDDAYLSVYKEACPRLKAKGYPFTVFVATSVVDQGIPAYMDWEQMAEMQKHGATFTNHSQHHDYLVRKKEGESQEAWKERMVKQEPVDPVTTLQRPQLTVTLAPSSANLDQLACYLGNKKMKIHWPEHMEGNN